SAAKTKLTTTQTAARCFAFPLDGPDSMLIALPPQERRTPRLGCWNLQQRPRLQKSHSACSPKDESQRITRYRPPPAEARQWPKAVKRPQAQQPPHGC